MALADHLHMGGGTITEQLVARIEALEAENAALRETLKDIAKQKKTTELVTVYDVEVADFEDGYDLCIDVARAALARQTEGEG